MKTSETRRVTLTGATGFVGRKILQNLLDSDHDVRVLVRDSLRVKEKSPKLEIKDTADLFGEPAHRMRELLEGSDTLIHAAWYAEPGKYLHSPLNIDCLAGTLRLANAFMATGGTRFVGIGTCFEYDLANEYLSIHSPLAPRTIYAAAKLSAFHTLSHYFSNEGISFAWCRLFYLYGDGEHEYRLVPSIRNAVQAGKDVLLTDGNQVRDYMDVGSVAREIVSIALSSKCGPVNVCSGEPITVRELAEKVADGFSARHLLKFGAIERRPDEPNCLVGVRD